MRRRTTWFAGIGLLGALALAGPLAAQDRPSPEAEDVWVKTGPLWQRLGALKLTNIQAVLTRKWRAWDDLKLKGQQQFDRWVDMLAPLSDAQLKKLFEPVKGETAEPKLIAFLDQTAIEGGRPPARDHARVVVLAIGGGDGTFGRLIGKLMVGAEKKPSSDVMPRLVADILPWGTLLTNFNSQIPDGRGFLGFLLTGRSKPGFVKQGQLIFLGAPMIGELYRRWEGNEAAPAHKAWVLYRDADVRLENCQAKGFNQGQRKQVAVWGTEIRNISRRPILERVAELREPGGSPFDVGVAIGGMSADKLNVNRFIDDSQASRFVAYQTAMAKAATPDSDVFLARAAAALLRHEMDPRIVVVRLGRPVLPAGLKAWNNAAKDAATRDLDALVGAVWDAARSNTRWRHRTYFWLILENSKLAFVSGPDVAPGVTSKARAGLKQVVPTVVKMLGYDPEEFLDGLGKVNKKPIDELFVTK